MHKDTLISVIVLLILAYLFSTEYLYFYSLIAIIIMAVLVIADLGSNSKGKHGKMTARADSANFDHHANAGSYVGPMEHLGSSAATAVEWPFRMAGWMFGVSKYDDSQAESPKHAHSPDNSKDQKH